MWFHDYILEAIWSYDSQKRIGLSLELIKDCEGIKGELLKYDNGNYYYVIKYES